MIGDVLLHLEWSRYSSYRFPLKFEVQHVMDFKGKNKTDTFKLQWKLLQ